MISILLAGVMLVGVASLAPQAAWGAEPVAAGPGAGEVDDAVAATELVKLAAAQYDQGRFDEALNTLRAARAISTRPGILYNIGQVERARHDCAGARDAYRSFLALTPETDANHERALRWQTEMQACLDARGASGATGEARPHPEREKFLQPQAADGPTASAVDHVQPAVLRASLSTGLPQVPPATELSMSRLNVPSPGLPGAGRRTAAATIVGWSLIGAGALAVSAALWFAVDAHSIETQLDQMLHTAETGAARRQQGERDTTWAIWSGVSAGVLAVSGGAVLILGRSGGPGAGPVALAGWAGSF